MGFLDFYDINLMRTQKGFHVMEMPEFLAKEGVTGGLHNRLPPQNSTHAWGKELWKYLAEVILRDSRFDVHMYVMQFPPSNLEIPSANIGGR